MKRSSSSFLAASSVAALLLAGACADSESEGQPNDPDGGASMPPQDGATPMNDGGMEDATPRVCSDEGFCHTTVPPNQTLRAVWSDGAGIVWAGTDEGAILRWDGAQWNVHASGLGPIAALWGSSATEIWAAGAEGIYRGKGETSTTVAFAPSPLPGGGRVHIASIWGSRADDIWAAGYRTDGGAPDGRVYHLSGTAPDGGAPVWTLDRLSSTPDRTFERVWGSAASGVWIVSMQTDEFGNAQQFVLRRPVGASAFSAVAFPPYIEENMPDGVPAHVFGAAVSSETSMWLSIRTDWGQYGYYHGISKDNGRTFEWTITPDFHDTFAPDDTALAATEDEAWAVGNYGRVKRWDGKAFEQAVITVRKVPVIDPFYGVWTSGGEVWAVGKGIALHRAKK